MDAPLTRPFDLGPPSAARLVASERGERDGGTEAYRRRVATPDYFFFAVRFAGFFAAFFAAGFFVAAFFVALANVLLLSMHEPNRLARHFSPTWTLTTR